jgi:DMSO/TMAO reductase YedYZ molybdopterin-dependent catalytic subunit
MNRRRFILLVGMAAASPVRESLADHEVISAEPLLVVSDLRSVTARYTSIEDFYVRNHHGMPKDVHEGTIRIEGAVEKPLQLMAKDLRHLPQREIGAVLECAASGVGKSGKALLSDGIWGGWSLGDVLSMARPLHHSSYMHLFGLDGYARSVPLGHAYDGGILATRLNRQPLPHTHGAPWRAFFPGWYGMDSVKWLWRIVVSASPLPPNPKDPYLELRRGLSGEVEARSLPRVQVNSVIVSPANRTVLHPGMVEVRGIAWSGEGKVSLVEVSVDGGRTWFTARLDSGSRYEWALWRLSLDLKQRGVIEIMCRATDETGARQPAHRDASRVDGYVDNWYHGIRCMVL